MRLVLDTDVMVAAIRSNLGASRRVLLAALEKRFALMLSVPLAFEYEAVLTRPEHLTASGLSAADIRVLLDSVVSAANAVRLAYLSRPVLQDPDDDMVLEAAINGQALACNYRRHFAAAARFGIIVCVPGEVLNATENES